MATIEKPHKIMPWHEDVRGTQVLPIIDLDDDVLRVEAGPGTGKTFGLVKRVQRLLHPEGLNLSGDKVLVVAFNRVIAKQLHKEIEKGLENIPHNGNPEIQTIHALCLKVIGSEFRIILPHEREAMIYDVLVEFAQIRRKYRKYDNAEQALKNHEAGHNREIELWQAVQRWLTRHHAQLISELPSLLLDKIQGGDFSDEIYSHVIVDEFQDLTPGEQKLVYKFKASSGKLLALGDPRQSIYHFRGNDKDGLSKIENLITPAGSPIRNITMTECQRCPQDIVTAANQLMGLYDSKPMIPGNQNNANLHVVVWKSYEAESKGMAKAIVDNIRAHPKANGHLTHLAMVTRRQFGYRLREDIKRIDPSLKVDLSFSESLLESWTVREAFIFFCLLFDPDAPTWRAWLGYKNSSDGKKYKAPNRNAGAYLKILSMHSDLINDVVVQQIAREIKKPIGSGGENIWARAKRYVELKTQMRWDGIEPLSLLEEIFNADRWGGNLVADSEIAKLDMELILTKSCGICREIQTVGRIIGAKEQLKEVARRLRYQIATREPFLPEENSDIQVSTLWGAKGVTADHVYVIGLCNEAIPGTRREEYPGSDNDFKEEQRRLFYVSITRSKKTLVLSRANSITPNQAKKLGFDVNGTGQFRVVLNMSTFLRDIIKYLPEYVKGEDWPGCST